MKQEVVLGTTNVCQYAFIAIQTDWVFQWIQLALAIACSLVLLAYRLWKWYKEAKADGKITGDEIKEGINIAIEGGKEIQEKIDESKKQKGE